MTESRKTFERPDIEELIEEKRDRTVGWRHGGVEECQHGFECRLRVGGLGHSGDGLRRGGRDHGLEAALGCGGCGGEVDVLRAALAQNRRQSQQQRRAPGAAAAEQYRNPAGIKRLEDALFECWSLDDHDGSADSRRSIGMSMPRACAVSTAM